MTTIREMLKKQLPDSEVDYSQSLMVAFTARSGSTVITDSLAGMGTARRIDEIFNERGPVQNLLESAEVSSLSEYLNHIFARNMGKDRLIFKTNFSDFKPVEQSLDLASVFPNLKVVYLERQDKLLQAISMYKAVQSQKWHARMAATGSSNDEAIGLELDVDEVLRFKDITETQCKEWEAFFLAHGIDPFRIYYEDYCSAPEKTLRDVYQFAFGECYEGDISTNFRKLADEQSLEWRDIVADSLVDGA